MDATYAYITRHRFTVDRKHDAFKNRNVTVKYEVNWKTHEVKIKSINAKVNKLIILKNIKHYIISSELTYNQHNIKLIYRTLNLIITTDFYKNKVWHR